MKSKKKRKKMNQALTSDGISIRKKNAILMPLMYTL